MLVIGLTGGIGTGKSEVVRIVRELGAKVIEADLLGHDAYRPNSKVWREVVAAFGEGIGLGHGRSVAPAAPRGCLSDGAEAAPP